MASRNSRFHRPPYTGEIILDRSDGSILDVLRRRKMRLTRPEIHDVDALLAELIGFGDHRHGGGGLNSINAFSELHDAALRERVSVTGVIRVFLPSVSVSRFSFGCVVLAFSNFIAGSSFFS